MPILGNDSQKLRVLLFEHTVHAIENVKNIVIKRPLALLQIHKQISRATEIKGHIFVLFCYLLSVGKILATVVIDTELYNIVNIYTTLGLPNNWLAPNNNNFMCRP